MSIILNQTGYPAWARENSSRARNIEQIIRTGVLFLSNPQSIVSMEAGYTAANITTAINDSILGAAENPMAPTTRVDEEDPLPQPYGMPPGNNNGSLQAKPLTFSQLLFMMENFLEVVLRIRINAVADKAAPEGALNRSDKCVLAWQGLRVLVKLWETWRENVQRVKCIAVTLRKGVARPSRPATNSGLRVPVVRTHSTTVPFSSVSELCAEMLRLWDLFRPLIVAIVLLPARHELRSRWLRWAIMGLIELAIFIGSNSFSKLPPVIDFDGRRQNPVPESAMQSRTNALTSYLWKQPFFTAVLAGVIRRWIVHGWIARNIPLFGALLASSVQYWLKMQSTSYLFSSGNCA